MLWHVLFQNASVSFPFYLLTSLCSQKYFNCGWNNVTCNHFSHASLSGEGTGKAFLIYSKPIFKHHITYRISFLHLDTYWYPDFLLSITWCSNVYQQKSVSDSRTVISLHKIPFVPALNMMSAIANCSLACYFAEGSCKVQIINHRIFKNT